MSNNRLYAGGLVYEMSDDRLREVFSEYGTVESARVITDRMTGRSRGFGFVEMSSDSEAQEAIDNLDGVTVDGRRMTVNIARPPQRSHDRRDDRRGGGRWSGRRRW